MEGLEEMMLDELLRKRRQQAEAGRRFWLSLVKEYGIGTKEYVLLLPPDTLEYHEPALLHLEDFLKKKHAERAVVLFAGTGERTAEEMKAWVRHFSDMIFDVREMTRTDYENLLRFYCLYEFTDRMVIASLEEPDGRLGRNMVGRKGLTLEDVVKVTLYD